MVVDDEEAIEAAIVAAAARNLCCTSSWAAWNVIFCRLAAFSSAKGSSDVEPSLESLFMALAAILLDTGLELGSRKDSSGSLSLPTACMMAELFFPPSRRFSSSLSSSRCSLVAWATNDLEYPKLSLHMKHMSMGLTGTSLASPLRGELPVPGSEVRWAELSGCSILLPNPEDD